MKLLLLTGMTGAGRSLTLKMLEDCGYESLDNIPPALLHAIGGSVDQKRNLAVGVNVSGKDFPRESFLSTVEFLRKNPALDFKLIFVEADDDILLERLQAVSEHHPALTDRSVRDGVKYERQHMKHIRDEADVVIDTSEYEDLDLRKFIGSHFSEIKKSVPVIVTSFSFKRGIPREADFVFDARFLQNPHYDPALKALTGLEENVAAYIEKDPDFKSFFGNAVDLLHTVLPRQLEKNHIVTVAIGCTGGRHRSVHVAEKLGAKLKVEGYETTIRHRDML